MLLCFPYAVGCFQWPCSVFFFQFISLPYFCFRFLLKGVLLYFLSQMCIHNPLVRFLVCLFANGVERVGNGFYTNVLCHFCVLYVSVVLCCFVLCGVGLDFARLKSTGENTWVLSASVSLSWLSAEGALLCI